VVNDGNIIDDEVKNIIYDTLKKIVYDKKLDDLS